MLFALNLSVLVLIHLPKEVFLTWPYSKSSRYRAPSSIVLLCPELNYINLLTILTYLIAFFLLLDSKLHDG